MLVDKREPRIRRMFADVSARYDLLNHVLSLNVDRYWRWRTTRLAPAVGSAPILDLCTGTADLALAYSRKFGDTVPVVAADFCHEMLAIGAQKATRRGNRISGFVEADAQRLPFGSERFQLVTVAFGVRNITDASLGLQEVWRVLKPGGRVAILEFSIPRSRLFRPLYFFYFRRILPLIGKVLSPGASDAYDYLPQSVLEFPQGDGFLKLMESTGYQNLQMHRFTFGIATLYLGTKS